MYTDPAVDFPWLSSWVYCVYLVNSIPPMITPQVAEEMPHSNAQEVPL